MIDVGSHLLEKLFLTELFGMSGDFLGIDFEIAQPLHGRRYGFDCLCGKKYT
jgi:hypothetical protein